MNKLKIYTMLLTLILLMCVGCVDSNEKRYYENHKSFVLTTDAESTQIYDDAYDLEVEAYDAYIQDDYVTSKSKYISYSQKNELLLSIYENQSIELNNLYDSDDINTDSYCYLRDWYALIIRATEHEILHSEYMIKSIDSYNTEDEQMYYELAIYHWNISINNMYGIDELTSPMFYV